MLTVLVTTLLLLLLSFFNPWSSIHFTHSFPYASNYVRDVPVIRFDAHGDLLLRDETAPEEDERVSWSRNVAIGLLSGMRLLRQGLWRRLSVVRRGCRIYKGARLELLAGYQRWIFGGELVRRTDLAFTLGACMLTRAIVVPPVTGWAS